MIFRRSALICIALIALTGCNSENETKPNSTKAPAAALAPEPKSEAESVTATATETDQQSSEPTPTTPISELKPGDVVYISADSNGQPNKVHPLPAPELKTVTNADGSETPIFSIDIGGRIGTGQIVVPMVGGSGSITLGNDLVTAGAEAYVSPYGQYGYGGYLRLRPVAIYKNGGVYGVVHVGKFKDTTFEKYGPYKYWGAGLGWDIRDGYTSTHFEAGFLKNSCDTQERIWLCDPMTLVYAEVGADLHLVLAKTRKKETQK
jgi:hypothetical protein